MEPASGKTKFSAVIAQVNTEQRTDDSQTDASVPAGPGSGSNTGKQGATSPGIRNESASARNEDRCRLYPSPERRMANVLPPDVVLARLLSMASLPLSETGAESEDLAERLRHALMELAALDSCEAVGEILRIYPRHCTPPLLSQALARASHAPGNDRMIALLKAHGAEPDSPVSAVVEPPVP